MSLLHTYLADLHAVRVTGAGVKETSYYPAVSNAFNALGKTLKPAVRCVINLKNQGAGIPDGGFLTPEQFAKAGDAPLPAGLKPSRGVMEVKGTGDALAAIVASAQVAKYWDTYGQVLVTNLRDFALVGRGPSGQKATLEQFSLAESEAAFWALAAHPQSAPDGLADRFAEYLQRVLLHAAPLATPQDVAWFLASYARDARSRVEQAGVPALQSIRSALEEALGLTFQGEKGAHFFRSTLVQTLFYGLFSAWVLWSRLPEAQEPSARFEWKQAAYHLHVPMIQTLFEEVAKPSQLGALDLVEVLEWTGAALNRVDRAAFFANFDGGHAVQYFYEPFLQAFDPELRKDLGVWYTPPEIVRYMVARVDTALREELGLPDGLADPNVYVQDPCCGTGAYLVEVLKHIQGTLDAQGGDGLSAYKLKQAAQERVFGFEILPAPYVVAHLQLGLLLQNAGAPLAPAQGATPAQRVGVYLTNALTGWEPPKEPKGHLLFPELEAERDRADVVKQQKPILVILGNPPYNSFAGLAVEEERALSLAYRTTKTAPAPQGQGLNDLYVRFFRMAERRITEQTGQGIVCFISNSSWLDGLSHTGMRERYLEAFDTITIDNLNGDKYKTGKVTPEGLPDPSAFSTELNREGIQVGTAIALMTRKKTHPGSATVQFKNWWGKGKRADLLASLEPGAEAVYHPLTPAVKLGLPFMPLLTGEDYQEWPLLPNLFPVFFPGVQAKRDDLVVDINQGRLEHRMSQYFDAKISHEQMTKICPRGMEKTNRFNPSETRDYLLKRGFLPKYVVRYCYRPFDTRWIYWEPETRLLGEKVSSYFPHVFKGNVWMVTQQRPRREWSLPQVIGSLGCLDLMDRSASCVPLLLKPKPTAHLFADTNAPDAAPQPNLSPEAHAYLSGLDADAGSLFYHTLAMLHAPDYREENAGALRQDWPRVPLPDSKALLEQSAALGRQVAALLDTETPVPGVTAGIIRPELRTLGTIARVGGGALKPESGDLSVTAGWGHGGKEGVTMPGKGKALARDYTPDERAALGEATALLGPDTRDIYLNGVAFWKNVPAHVWDFTLGGYQVLKKWLSYREYPLLGRPLTPDEAREVTHTARRLAALRLLAPALDANYQAAKAAAYAWGEINSCATL